MLILLTVVFLSLMANCGQDRIQLFKPGEMNRTAMFGNGVSICLKLDCRRELMTDANAYLFIVDPKHDRVVGSRSYGFRCIIGCSDTSQCYLISTDLSSSRSLRHRWKPSTSSIDPIFRLKIFSWQVVHMMGSFSMGQISESLLLTRTMLQSISSITVCYLAKFTWNNRYPRQRLFMNWAGISFTMERIRELLFRSNRRNI